MPSGTLDVTGKLKLDGGNFTNTGFINAGTIELNNVDLINAQRLAAVSYNNFIAQDHWSETSGYAVQPGGVMNASNWIINNIKLDANGKPIEPVAIGGNTGPDGDGIVQSLFQGSDLTGSITCVGNCTFGVIGGQDGESLTLQQTLATAAGSTYSSSALNDMLNTMSEAPPPPWYKSGALGVVVLIVTMIINAFCTGCMTPAIMALLHVDATVALAVEAALIKIGIQTVASGQIDLGEDLQTLAAAFMTGEFEDFAGGEISIGGVKLNQIGTSSSFWSLLAKNAINGSIGAGVNAFIYNQPLNGASLLGSAFVNTLMQEGANEIGNLATNGVAATPDSDAIPATITSFEQMVLHAGLGCLGGAALAGNMSGCAPGAAGAVAAEVTAKNYTPTLDVDTTRLTPDEKNQLLALATEQASTGAAAIAGSLVGGAAGGNIAAATGSNAVANNYLNHNQQDAFKTQLAGCNGNSGCIKSATLSWMGVDSAQSADAQTCVGLGNCTSIAMDARTGTGFTSDEVKNLCNGEATCVSFASNLGHTDSEDVISAQRRAPALAFARGTQNFIDAGMSPATAQGLMAAGPTGLSKMVGGLAGSIASLFGGGNGSTTNGPVATNGSQVTDANGNPLQATNPNSFKGTTVTVNPDDGSYTVGGTGLATTGGNGLATTGGNGAASGNSLGTGNTFLSGSGGNPQLAIGVNGTVAIPSGFTNSQAFSQFGVNMRSGLSAAGYPDVEPILQGSAVTGVSYATGQPFDAGRVSDFDVALASPTLLQAAADAGIGLRSGGTRTGPLSAADLKVLGLQNLANQMSQQAGREVNFMIYNSVTTATQRAPSVVLPHSP